MSVKNKYLIKFFSVFLIALFASPVFAKSLKNKTVYVSVENIMAKKSPSFWSGGSDNFSYGDAVSVVEEKDSWVKVVEKKSGRQGWLKSSVVTTKKINPKRKTSFDADEIALAGKGFSSPLEAEYSGQNNLDDAFEIVDEIESEEISPVELQQFIIKGELNVEGLIGEELLDEDYVPEEKVKPEKNSQKKEKSDEEYDDEYYDDEYYDDEYYDDYYDDDYYYDDEYYYDDYYY